MKVNGFCQKGSGRRFVRLNGFKRLVLGLIWGSLCFMGFHRYTFPASDTSAIIFDTGAFLAHGLTPLSGVWRVNDQEIAGFEVMGKTLRRPKDTRVYFKAIGSLTLNLLPRNLIPEDFASPTPRGASHLDPSRH